MRYDIDKPEIARRLRVIAQRRSMDAAEIGRRAGMAPNVVGRYLSGEIEPKASNLLRLLDALAATPQSFMEIPFPTVGEGAGRP